ncbi:MAG: phenylalanine--tRNA ligase subunit beta, partial [Candidatus Omnitrophica bacterium]|nr:phenylalanine--tRNA ligase subunit beta [Candidatus Omnitrophota bacterium]
LAEALTMAGIQVASLEHIDDDYIYDFEITSNRSDCLSTIGLAREIGAITGQKLVIPPELSAHEGPAQEKFPVAIKIKNKELCPRYTGRIVRNVRIQDSPDGLKTRLTSIGMRPVNTVVDVTNFLLMETGQPMHAFDLDKIHGSIIVRTAQQGETIRLLDGSVKTLENGMLVIADEHGPIAVAGVMGGSATEVSHETRSVFLESACFDPISVRRTARALGLATESSYRFERKIDLSQVAPASFRAASMMRDIAEGVIEGFKDVDHTVSRPNEISLIPEHVDSLLGIDIPVDAQKKYLQALGFTVSGDKKCLKLIVPVSRRDIGQEVDVIEEIARVYGYNKIPETLPHQVGAVSLVSRDQMVKKEVRRLLSGLGAHEIMTYNLSTRENAALFDHKAKEEACIKNPRSKEQEVMTQTLMAGMMRAIAWNINRRNTNLVLFEIGKTYGRPSKDMYTEEARLTVGMTGIVSEDWQSPQREYTFYDLKGTVKTLLEKLGIEDVKYGGVSTYPYLSTAVGLDQHGSCIGIIGTVAASTLEALDIKQNVYIAELYLDMILKEAVLERSARPIPKYPSVIRDISIVADSTAPAGGIISRIRERGSGLLKKITLISRYQGKQIPEGKVGLLYRLEYRDDTRTLTDEEVEKEHTAIKEHLAAKHGIAFR